MFIYLHKLTFLIITQSDRLFVYRLITIQSYCCPRSITHKKMVCPADEQESMSLGYEPLNRVCLLNV